MTLATYQAKSSSKDSGRVPEPPWGTPLGVLPRSFAEERSGCWHPVRPSFVCTGEHRTGDGAHRLDGTQRTPRGGRPVVRAERGE
jgi:hypothetical protein